MVCQGICDRLKVFPPMGKKSVYDAGIYARCSICEGWFVKNGVRCECCHSILKTKPRDNRQKRLNRERLM